MSEIIVKGTDNIIPGTKSNPQWMEWNYNDIYLGMEGEGKYIPSVGDGVVKYATQERWHVLAIDHLTKVPTLERVIPSVSGELPITEVMIGSQGPSQTSTYRIYLNTEVTPYTLDIDRRIDIRGSSCRSMTLFKGTDISETGKVISQLYDPQGNIISTDIPLEIVAIDNLTNFAIKTIPTFHTNEEMLDGEIVTMVVMSDTGKLVTRQQLLIENTNFVRKSQSGYKHIESISLVSELIDPTDPGTLRLPANINVSGISIGLQVNYSDGSHRLQTLNDDQFELFGLNNFLTGVGNREFKVVAGYLLGDDETYTGNTTQDNSKITKPYNLVVEDSNPKYDVTIMGYPVWVNTTTGYKMQWWLLNLDRSVCIDVSDIVQYDVSHSVLHPTKYDITQSLKLSVELGGIIPGITEYTHEQRVDVTLNPPSLTDSVWLMDFNTTSSSDSYGMGVTAQKNNNTGEIDITQDALTLNNWLQTTYHRMKPLLESYQVTEGSPIPTHVEITCEGETVRKSLDTWPLAPIAFEQSKSVSETVSVKFLKITPDKEQILGIVGMIITITD